MKLCVFEQERNISVIAIKVTGHPAVSSGPLPVYFIKAHWLLVALQFSSTVTERLLG